MTRGRSAIRFGAGWVRRDKNRTAKALPPPTKLFQPVEGSQGEAWSIGNIGTDDGDDGDDNGGENSDPEVIGSDGRDDFNDEYFSSYLTLSHDDSARKPENEVVALTALLDNCHIPAQHWEKFLDERSRIRDSNFSIKRALRERRRTTGLRSPTRYYRYALQQTLMENCRLENYVEEVLCMAGSLSTAESSLDELAREVLVEVIAQCQGFDDPDATTLPAKEKVAVLRARIADILEAIQREVASPPQNDNQMYRCRDVQFVENLVRERCPTPEEPSSSDFEPLAWRWLRRTFRDIEGGIREVKSLDQVQFVLRIIEGVELDDITRYRQKCAWLQNRGGRRERLMGVIRSHSAQYRWEFDHARCFAGNNWIDWLQLETFWGRDQGQTHTLDIEPRDAQEIGWARERGPPAIYWRHVAENGFIFKVNVAGEVLGIMNYDGTYIGVEVLDGKNCR